MARSRLTSRPSRTTTLVVLLVATAIRSAPSSRGATPEPPPAIANAPLLPIDRGARQIVANHPIIPVPTAAWPAIFGVAFVARRAIAVANRAS